MRRPAYVIMVVAAVLAPNGNSPKRAIALPAVRTMVSKKQYYNDITMLSQGLLTGSVKKIYFVYYNRYV